MEKKKTNKQIIKTKPNNDQCEEYLSARRRLEKKKMKKDKNPAVEQKET